QMPLENFAVRKRAVEHRRYSPVALRHVVDRVEHRFFGQRPCGDVEVSPRSDAHHIHVAGGRRLRWRGRSSAGPQFVHKPSERLRSARVAQNDLVPGGDCQPRDRAAHASTADETYRRHAAYALAATTTGAFTSTTSASTKILISCFTTRHCPRACRTPCQSPCD